jgi:hypothetical protein
MLRSLLVSALSALIGGLAAADEVWEGEDGSRIIYERDEASYAVFRGPGNVLYYFDGLAGNYSNRQGVFTGYWFVENGQSDNREQACRTGNDGSLVYASAAIRFYSPSFPSGFELARGYCEGPRGADGYPQEFIMTFHHYSPVTSVAGDEPEVDTGYNDNRPGMNQQYECIDRLRNFQSSFARVQDVESVYVEQSQNWRVTGTMISQFEYHRPFECFHANGRVERIVFGQGQQLPYH